MSEILQFLEIIFKPVVIVFAVSNLFALGLQVKMPEVIAALKNMKGMALILVAFVLFGQPMLETAGSFALLAATIFMVGMALITYRFGFGLKQNQRSVMALGMGTRNLAAIITAAFAIPNVDPRIVTFIIMWGGWSFVLAAIGARVFGKRAG